MGWSGVTTNRQFETYKEWLKVKNGFKEEENPRKPRGWKPPPKEVYEQWRSNLQKVKWGLGDSKPKE